MHVASLRQRILRAGAWTTGAYGGELLLRLLSNLLLTRLLSPEAFGLAAASGSIMMGLALISDFGIRSVIIQSKRGATEEFLYSAWVFQSARGVIIWLVLCFFCAVLSIPVVRSFFSSESVFANPVFPVLTITLGFSLILSSLESTAIALNIRELNYGSVAILGLGGMLVSLPIMIAFAWFFESVWALAAGALSGGLVRLILSHFAVPGPRMKLRLSMDHVQEIVRFGKWITVSSIGTFFAVQSDVILLGLLFPSSILGVYFIAKTLIDAVEGLLERLNGSLTLPVLSEVLRTRPNELRDRYYRLRFPIEGLSELGAGFLFAIAVPIISLLYDARYSSAGPMLQLLALGLAIYPFQLIRSAFTAVGKTRIVALVSVAHAVSLVPLVLLGFYFFGLIGSVASVALSRLVPSVLFLFLAHDQKWISIWRELRTIPIFAFGFFIGEGALELENIFGFSKMRALW